MQSLEQMNLNKDKSNIVCVHFLFFHSELRSKNYVKEGAIKLREYISN